MKIFVAILAVLVAAIAVTEAVPDKVVCYFGSWAEYRVGDGNFNIANIDPNLCTHLIYAFVGLVGNEVKILDPNIAIDKGGFQKFVQLKNKNPNLKTLVAIGGWNEGSESYSLMVSNPTSRAAFVNNVLAFLKLYKFDGFDVDWEYPAQRGGVSSDKANYILLLKELRAKLNPEGLLLTAAVGASESNIASSYNVPEMVKYLDFINVMTYDLHGSSDRFTGQNAPLLPSSKDITVEAKKLNVKYCIEAWIAAGAPPSKLVLGMGVYGRSFTLKSPGSYAIGSPAGSGAPGPYTGEGGFLGYNEICEKVKFGGWTEGWDDEQKVPFAYQGANWVGYDNPRSIALKVDFIKSKGLGGGMIWSIETDDFRGKCGSVYPILNAINSNLFGTGPEPVTPTTSAPVITPPTNGGFSCTSIGYFKDPSNCKNYYWCTSIGGTPLLYPCAEPLVFDPTISACNWNQGQC